MIKRKIITVLIILTMISFTFSGCGKKEDEFDDYALFQDEVETVVSGDPAKEETDSQVFSENEQTTSNNNKTTQSAEPVTNVSELFTDAELDQFTPFQDEEKSYCLINDGHATPVYDRGEGCYFPVSPCGRRGRQRG